MKTNSDTTTKLYIGFDVHKEKTAIALAEPGAGGEIRSYGEVSTLPPHPSRSLTSRPSRMVFAPSGAKTMDSAHVNRFLSDKNPITQRVDPES